MLGFKNMPLLIEKSTGTDLRGIPTYSNPVTKLGFSIEKTTYNYQTGKIENYIFITFQEPNLVSKEDKVNGFRVETVKNVYIHGQFLICEVTAR